MKDIVVFAWQKHLSVYDKRVLEVCGAAIISLKKVSIIYLGSPIKKSKLVAIAKIYGVEEIVDWRSGSSSYYSWRYK